MEIEKAGLVSGVSVDAEPTLPKELTTSPHPDYSAFLISRETHLKVPFDQQYEGGHFEDNSSHVRLHRAGIKAISINLPFLHHRSSTLKHADAREKERINQAFDANKARFLKEFGCVPGTPAYAELFSPASFGMYGRK